MHFTSLKGYNLKFPTVFWLVAPWFLAATTTWECFDSCKSKKQRKNQIIAYDTSKIIFRHYFLDFKLWQLTISKPVD